MFKFLKFDIRNLCTEYYGYNPLSTLIYFFIFKQEVVCINWKIIPWIFLYVYFFESS